MQPTRTTTAEWPGGEKGDISRAIADFGRAVDLDSSYVAALNNRGEMFEAIGKIDDAIADFRRALAIDPAHPSANRNLMRLQSDIAPSGPR